MKFNFKKISSVLGSAAMVGSTFALAAAANYPAPFVSGGSSDVAIVYGSAALSSDYSAATNIGSDLSATLATQSVSIGGDVTVTGESAPLFGGDKLYINDTLSTVKSVLSKSQLPTVLADQTFSGNVDAKLTHTIQLGSNPIVKFDKMPTSSDDPRFGLAVGTSAQSAPIYNATVSFNKAINFTHADSSGEEFALFGQTFTVASETDTTKLVLLKTAVKVNLDSDNPSQDVTVGGKKYTVTLVSASDSAATVMVTDDSGKSEQKEINEAASKKVNGVTIAVNTADETNLKLSASVIAGAEKVTFQNASSVTYGEDDTVIDGTYAIITGSIDASTGMIVSIAAPNSDKDAILPGSSFTDPVFGNFKVDFAGMNIADDSDMRESIDVKPSGDDKMEVTFTNYEGYKKSVQFAKNDTSGSDLINMHIDDSGRNITVQEKKNIYRNEYVVVGNEDEGHLLKLSQVTNQTGTSYSSDKVQFTDVFSGTTYESGLTGKGVGTVNVGGKEYGVTYTGASTNQDTIAVTLNYPDSTGTDIVLFPTIETSKGAKLAFYEPQTISLTTTGIGSGSFRLPDGDGYTGVAVAHAGGTTNFTFGGGSAVNLTAAAGASSATVSIGRLTYNFTSTGTLNSTKVYLSKVGGGNVADPGLVIFEEKDDDNDYEALVVSLEAGGNSDDGIGVNDVERTWDSDNTAWEYTLASDSKKTKETDLWGSLILTDSSDSDQASVMISYPDEQIYAQIYVSASDASVSAGGSSTILPVKDSEVSGVSSKNLIVIGGSCVNTVAAKLLGSDSPVCTSEFTSKTGVSSGQYLIQTFQSPYADSKIATLVAGYEAADTTNAVNSLKTNKPDTSVGKKFTGTTAGSLTAA